MDVKLIDELDEQGYIPVILRPEGFGITAREYAAAKHCSLAAARSLLDKAVDEGLLVKTMMNVKGYSGHPCVYHKPGEKP